MNDEVPPTEPMHVPPLAGRYRLEAVLGEGGMGVVHRAFDLKLRRHVAVKCLVPSDGEVGETASGRFMREARSVAHLNHPNVVAIHDVGEADGTSYIVMELVEGGTLRDRLHGPALVGTTQALEWLVQAAEALAAAHRAGLVHRDVKPANLLLDGAGRLKIADFGAVKALDGAALSAAPTLSAGVHDLTTAGRIIGTPRYMAPEQIRGEPLDGRSDQFAWGLVAYELLAGIHPYEATDPRATPQQLANGRFVPPPFAARRPELASAVEQVVLRALAPGRRDRFESMDELREALDVASGPRIATVPLPPLRPTPAPSTPSAVTTRLLASAPTGAAPTVAAPPPRSDRDVAPSHRPSSGVARSAIVSAALALCATVALFVAREHGRGDAPSASASDASPAAVGAQAAAPKLSESPEARTDYETATAMLRQGAGSLARLYYERALSHDAGFVQARVHVAWLLLRHDVHASTQQYGLALSARERLRPSEEPLLRALGPLLTVDVPDLDGSRKILEEATDRYPRDAELACTLAFVRMAAGDRAAASAAVDRCQALDPGRVTVKQERAVLMLAEGKEEEAEKELDRCLAEMGGSNCLRQRLQFRRDRGRCREALEDATRLSRENDAYADAKLTLAESRFGDGQTKDLIDGEFALWRRASDAKKERLDNLRTELYDALVVGDIKTAAQKEVMRVEYDHLDRSHSFQDLLVVETLDALEEVGSTAEAGKRAAWYFAHEASWTRSVDLPDQLLLLDPAPRLVRAMRAARTANTPDPSFLAERSRRAAPRVSPELAWLWAHAVTPTTPEEAKAALDDAARSGTAIRPSSLDLPGTSLVLARLYALAGDDASASRYVQDATRACPSFTRAVQRVQAFALQGEVQARRGESDAACTSFQKVLALEHEGASATRAKTGMKRLACKAAH